MFQCFHLLKVDNLDHRMHTLVKGWGMKLKMGSYPFFGLLHGKRMVNGLLEIAIMC